MHAQSLNHAQLFCDPMDCSLPGSSGLFQARTLEQVAISYSRDLSDPEIETVSLASPALAGGFFFLFFFFFTTESTILHYKIKLFLKL